MKTDSATDLVAARLAKAIRDYVPRHPTKFQKLMPMKDSIEELRSKGVSYAAIAGILRDINVPVASDTVFRFCHEVLREPKARYRRKRKPSTLRVRKQPDKPSPTPPVLSPGGSSQKHDRWTQVNGPRIADPNTI